MSRWFAISSDFATDTKIEALMEQFGGAAGMVVVVLLGRAKKADNAGHVSASVRTLANEAFFDRGQVPALVEEAEKLELITVEKNDGREVKVKFTAWKRWQDAGRKARQREAKKASVEANVPSSPEVSPTVPEVSPTDRQTDKTEQTDRETAPAPVPEPDAPLSHLLADLIAGLDPNGKRPTVGRDWIAAEDRMIRLDGRDPTEAERLLRWTMADPFWQNNVRSMPKFRKQYGRLYGEAKNGGRSKARDPAPGMTQAEQRAAAIRAKRDQRGRAAV